MRCVLVAERKKISQVFINKIFDSIWNEGLNLNDNKIFEEVLKKINIDPNTFLVEIANLEIKEELKKKTNDAYAKGIFGTPTFIVNNKIFWGQDRLEFAISEAEK